MLLNSVLTSITPRVIYPRAVEYLVESSPGMTVITDQRQHHQEHDLLGALQCKTPGVQSHHSTERGLVLTLLSIEVEVEDKVIHR